MPDGPTKIDWKATDQSILRELDIQSEYVAAGLKLAGDTPNGNGWIECHAIGRDDRNPSAGVNVGDGPARGRYRDFGDGGVSLNMWDAIGKLTNRTWREARADLASRTSIVIPDGESRRASEKLHLSPLTPATPMLYARRKHSIHQDSIVLCGGRYASLPVWRPPEDRQYLIAFPCWTPEFENADPSGYHSVAQLGQLIQQFDRKGKPTNQTKTKQTGESGLINDFAMRNWVNAKVIWVVEGITDMLAMQSLMQTRTDHVVISFGGASKSHSLIPFKPLFAGKDVRILFDSDPPSDANPTGAGHAGAVMMIDVLVDSCESIRNVRLPYKNVAEKKDFRDWVKEESIDSFERVIELSERYLTVNRAQASAEKEKLRPDGIITNYISVPLDGGGVLEEPLDFGECFDRTMAATGNWPRRVGESKLFIDTGDDEKRIVYLKNPNALFGFYWNDRRVDWINNKKDKIGKGEFFESLKSRAPGYRAIEEFPHFPNQIPDVYYAHRKYSPGDGDFLTEFLGFFKPAEPEDYYLLEAMVMTLLWGGPSGARPCFLMTTSSRPGEGGVGTGKSVTAQYIANLVGGYNEFDRGESIETIKKRLLSGSSLNRRVLMIDNIKSHRFSWSGLEAMVTGKEVSGHAMYAGNDSTPNYYTWFLTLNSPSLGTDIAKRCIPVELSKPIYSKDWQRQLDIFVEEHHHDVIEDVMAKFLEEPKAFDNKLRWGVWAQEVLGRVKHPQEPHDIVMKRQEEFNAQEDESHGVEQVIREKLRGLGYRIPKTDEEYEPNIDEVQSTYPEDRPDLYDGDTVFIPTSLISEWLSSKHSRTTPDKVASLLRQGISEGTIKQMRYAKGERLHNRRGFIFGCVKSRLNEGQLRKDILHKIDGTWRG